MTNSYELAWNYLVELRTDIVNSQRLRNQIIGFKITLVITGSVFLAANLDKIPDPLEAPVIVAPPLAAIFFDLLIFGVSMSIKRIGFYIRVKLEPFLKTVPIRRTVPTWPAGVPMWEEWEGQYGYNKSSPSAFLGVLSDLGLTSLLTILAFAMVIRSLVESF